MSNKKHIAIFCLPVLLWTAVACKESLPERFQDIEGVYFNNLLPNRVHTDRLDLTFIYEDADVMEVPVRIQLLGRPSEADRPVALTCTSSDAVEGVDFELTGAAVLSSGETSSDYVVRLKRTPTLKSETKTLMLQLSENESFIIPFKYFTQAGGAQTAADRLTISFSDQFTAAPAGWDAMYIGAFSQQKFELISRVMEIPRADFNVVGKISSAKWIFIQEQMTLYVKEQQKLKEKGEDYDPQAFDGNGDLIRFQ